MRNKKLTENQVIKIKDALILGRQTQQEIAETYGVSRSTISNIATSRLYADIGPSLEIPKCRQEGRLQRTPEAEAIYWQGQFQRMKLHKERSDRKLRDLARTASTVTGAVEALSDIIRPITPPKVKNYRPKKKGDIVESAVLMLSDLHADEVVEPQEVDYLEEFNFPICVKRACHLVQEVAKWCNRSLDNFHFDELVILGMGDYTNGEIHRAENYFGDQMTADLAIGELIGHIVADLASHFPHVRFCNVTGNHGRRSQKIEFDKKAENNNHDTLIARIAQIYCRDLENVTFKFPDAVSHIVPIKGFNYHMTHGHGKRTASNIWQRSESFAKNTNAIHKGRYDYFVQGHYHTPGRVGNLISNGAFLATDQFSYQSLQAAGSPTQILFGSHEHNGATWSLPIDLRYDEKTQENRYESLERFYD